MAITYHSGRRIQGTQADFDGTPAVYGGWKEVGRTTLGSAGDTITVSSLPNKRYYMFLNDLTATGGTIAANLRLNNDNSGTVGVSGNYARRRSINGGSDNTYTNDVNMTLNGNTDTNPRFDVGYLANLSSKEKLNITHGVYQTTAGAGYAPTRTEIVNKWDNTSDAINRLDVVNAGTGNFDTGSEVVVLGWDPDDTHTDNFWEELASVDWSSGGSISSGTISAKKYLWVQAYSKNDSTSGQAVIKFNSDGGTNYADRYSYNGGSDATNTLNVHGLLDSTGSANDLVFYNMFIINNSANEKLIINHSVNIGGTGEGNAPYRTKNVFKWTNTGSGSQITDIEFKRHAGNMTAGILKVWGSD